MEVFYIMKVYLEIVHLKHDVVTASSGGQQECECFDANVVSNYDMEDDC